MVLFCCTVFLISSRSLPFRISIMSNLYKTKMKPQTRSLCASRFNPIPNKDK